MKFILFLNLIVSLVVFIILIKCFFKHFSEKRIEKVSHILLIIGLVYFVFSALSFFWLAGFLEYSELDFQIIYSILILIQTLVFVYIVYLFSLDKTVFFYLFLYLFGFLSLIFASFNFFNLLFIESFLLTLLLFIYLSNRKDVYRKIGYIGISYAVISLVFQLFLLFEKGSSYVFSFFSNFIFLILIVNFVADLRKYPLIHLEYFGSKDKPFFVVLLKYFIFMIVLTNFVFIGTIGVHELGHFGVSYMYNCEHREIIFNEDFAHTNVLCKDLPNNMLVLLGGVLTPLVLAILMFLLGGSFIRSISPIVFGFGLILSNRDFRELGFSDNLLTLAVFLGFLSLFVGIIMLAKSRVDSAI